MCRMLPAFSSAADVLIAAASSAWVHRGFSLCKVSWGRTSRPFVFKCFKERTHVSLAFSRSSWPAFFFFVVSCLFFFLFKKKNAQNNNLTALQAKLKTASPPRAAVTVRPSLWPPPCPALLRHRTFQTPNSVFSWSDSQFNGKFNFWGNSVRSRVWAGHSVINIPAATAAAPAAAAYISWSCTSSFIAPLALLQIVFSMAWHWLHYFAPVSIVFAIMPLTFTENVSWLSAVSWTTFKCLFRALVFL